MKQKKIKRISALLLAVIIILAAFGGCAGDGGVSSGGTDSSVQAGNTGEGPYGLNPENRVTLDCFYNFTWYPVSEWKGIIAEEITRLTGVDMNLTIAVDLQQLGLLIASGDMPDLISTDRMFSNLSTNELCYDWQSLIDEYGLDWDIDQQYKANSLSFTQEEDKFFTILSHFSTDEDWKELDAIGMGAPMTSTISYRRDLYEEMGSPPIESLEDIHSLLLLAKETYPDLKPLIFDTVTWKFSYVRQQYGLGMGAANYIEQEDGNWVTWIKDPRYREYLSYINNLYRDGLFVADNFGMEGATIKAEIESGAVFAYTGGTQRDVLERTSALQEIIPEAEYWEMPVVGDPKGSYDASIGWMGTFISKNCKDPETAIRYMQFIHSEEGARLTQWGREGEEYTLDENGAPIFSEAWNQVSLEGRLDEVYNTSLYQGGTKINEAVARCAAIDERMTPNYESLRKNFSNKPWLKFAEPNEGTDMKIILDQLFDPNSGYIPTGEAKIILSADDNEFERNLQAMMDACESVGMNELEDYMNEHIKEAMKIYGVG